MNKQELIQHVNQLPELERIWVRDRILVCSATPPLQQAKEAFLREYIRLHNVKYYFTGKDAANLKQLLQKIAAHMREGGMYESGFTDNEVVLNLSAFCSAAYKHDAWIRDHFTLANLNSQFNQLYIKIKNNGKQTGGTISTDYKQRIFDDLCS